MKAIKELEGIIELVSICDRHVEKLSLLNLLYDLKLIMLKEKRHFYDIALLKNYSPLLTDKTKAVILDDFMAKSTLGKISE